LKKILSAIIIFSFSVFSAGIMTTGASATTTVTNYTLANEPVALAVSGNYAYSANSNGTISRVDVTTGTVVDTWATIPSTGLTFVKPTAIQIVGSFAYVTSSIKIASSNDAKVYVSKIPLSNPAGVVPDWAVIQGNQAQDGKYYDTATVMTSDASNLYVAYFSDDGSGYLYTGVRQISLANASTVADWKTGSRYLKASSITVVNGWVYTTNPTDNSSDPSNLACAALSDNSGSFGSCSGILLQNGYSTNAISFLGSTAYIAYENLNNGNVTLKGYSVSGDNFTPATDYSLTWEPGYTMTTDSNVIYVSGYGVVVTVDPNAGTPVTNPYADLNNNYQVPNGIVVSNGVVFVSNKNGKLISKITLATPPAPPAAITPSSQTLNGTQGTAFSSGSLTPTNFSSTVSYTISPGLPAGLSFNTSTGVISGTPTVSLASTVFTITATGTETATTTVTLTIAAASNQGSGGSNSNSTSSTPSSPSTQASNGDLAYTGNHVSSQLMLVMLLLTTGAVLIGAKIRFRIHSKQ
jgi:hypothetical protein